MKKLFLAIPLVGVAAMAALSTYWNYSNYERALAQAIEDIEALPFVETIELRDPNPSPLVKKSGLLTRLRSYDLRFHDVPALIGSSTVSVFFIVDEFTTFRPWGSDVHFQFRLVSWDGREQAGVATVNVDGRVTPFGTYKAEIDASFFESKSYLDKSLAVLVEIEPIKITTSGNLKSSYFRTDINWGGMEVHEGLNDDLGKETILSGVKIHSEGYTISEDSWGLDGSFGLSVDWLSLDDKGERLILDDVAFTFDSFDGRDDEHITERMTLKLKSLSLNGDQFKIKDVDIDTSINNINKASLLVLERAFLKTPEERDAIQLSDQDDGILDAVNNLVNSGPMLDVKVVKFDAFEDGESAYSVEGTGWVGIPAGRFQETFHPDDDLLSFIMSDTEGKINLLLDEHSMQVLVDLIIKPLEDNLFTNFDYRVDYDSDVDLYKLVFFSLPEPTSRP